MNEFVRAEQMLGKENMKRLSEASVAIFGIGGVGGAVAEALARMGIGRLTLVDHDLVEESNLNRQIIALHSTVGSPKVEVMKERIADINPNALTDARQVFYSAENADDFDFTAYDYIVDAVDTVSAKLLLIERAKQANVPILSSMGTGNKWNPMAFRIAEIEKTSVCPLARVMRRELKKRGIQKVKVLYSEELPCAGDGSRTPGSVSFVPPAAGYLIAAQVVKDLLK